MKYNPHEYQTRGQEMLLHPGGAGLGLDPGMGKTCVAASAFAELQTMPHGFEKLRMLVIVPIQPMYGTWPDECQKWDHLRHLKLSIIHGTHRKRVEALAADADIYLINPEGVTWLFDKGMEEKRPEWQVLCVDESTKFKRTTTARFRAIRKHLPKFHWRWIMTGTIAPNGLEDLFGQVLIMDLGKSLGQYITHFRQQYFLKGEYTWHVLPGSTEKVISKLDSRVLLLKARDYLNMPDLVRIERKITLPEDAREAYKNVEKEFIHELKVGAPILAANSGAASSKCRQIAGGAVYNDEGIPILLHDEKINALIRIMEETNGHPLLIMYEYRHERDRIMKLVGEGGVCVTGMSGSRLRDTIIAFNAGRIKYLIMHPGSTYGMNIQRSCHHIVWFSIIWNLEYYIQATMRLERQGQEAPSVMSYHLVADKTVDRKVSAALRQKDVEQADIEKTLRSYCGVTENYS